MKKEDETGGQDANEAAQKDAVKPRKERTNEPSLEAVRPEPIALREEYLTTVEVAHRTKMSTSFFEKMRCAGGGPRYIKCGRRVLYKQAEVVKFMEGRQRRSTSDPGEAPDGSDGA